MDKTQGGWDQVCEVGMAGVEGNGCKMETTVLEQQIRKEILRYKSNKNMYKIYMRKGIKL